MTELKCPICNQNLINDYKDKATEFDDYICHNSNCNFLILEQGLHGIKQGKYFLGHYSHPTYYCSSPEQAIKYYKMLVFC